MADGGHLGFMAGACFTAFSLAFAAMLLWTGPNIDASRRDNHAEMRWRLRLRTALLVGLICTVFGCGAAGLGQAKLLRVDFTGMRFDLAACAADRDCGRLGSKTLFVVGDDTATSDLVVRGRNYAEPKAHRLLTVHGDDAVTVEVTPYSLASGGLRTVAWRGDGASVMAGAACRNAGRRHLCRAQGDKPAPLPLHPGQALHVAVYDLRPVADGSDLRPYDLRSFVLALDRDGRKLTLTLDHPERATAGTCERPNMLLMQPVGGGMGSAITTENLAFRFLGARSDQPYAPYSLTGGRLLNEGIGDFCRDAWRPDVPTLTADTGPGFTFSYHKFEIPATLLLAAVIALLFVHMAGETYWTEAPVAGVLTGLAQYLLVVRALIGVRGAFLDSEANLSEIGFDAGASLICLPILLLALRPVKPGDWKTDAACLAVLGLFAIALKTWAGPVPGIYGVIFALPVLGLTWRRLWAWPSLRQAMIGRITALAKAFKGGDPFAWGVLILVATAAIRLALLVGHARERLLGFPLSPPYLLGLILGLALMIEGGLRRTDSRSGWIFVATFLFAVVAVPVLVHDNGVALTVIVPFSAVALWRVWAVNRSFRDHRLWWLPLPAFCALFGLFLAVIVLHRPPDLCPVDVADPACLQASLRYAEIMNDKNLIRVMALFAPGDVPRIGTSNAMESAQQVLHLATYGGSLTGHGYLAGIDSWGNLRDVHFSDNLSAIHLMYPFGRLAAIAFLTVVFAAVMAALRTFDGDNGWRRVAGQLALWTFFGTGAYMVLANLLLVPFTGRNIYLLAVTSIGDLVEGAMLLVLAILTLSAKRGAA